MLAPELMRFVRKEIEKYLNILMNSRTQSAGKLTEDVSGLFPGMQVLKGKPISRPYGFTSRAPDGTAQISARFGADPNAIMVVGHMDGSQPDLAAGEAAIYNSAGHSVKVTQSSIVATRGSTTITMDSNGVLLKHQGIEIKLSANDVKIGASGASNPVTLGTEIKSLFNDLIAWMQAHTHQVAGVTPGPATIPTLAPVTASQLTTIKANNIDNDKIVSQTVFVSKSP